MATIICKKKLNAIRGRNKRTGSRELLAGPYKSKKEAGEKVIDMMSKYSDTHSYITVSIL